MFKSLGKLKNQVSKKKISIRVEDIEEKTNFFDNFIIFKKNSLIKIFNRVCDHAGGKILSRKNESICPMHNWKFYPETGKYENGIKKKEITYKIKKNNLEFEIDDFEPEIQKFSDNNLSTTIRFFNHAFLQVAGNNFSFSIDPWAIGPAFNTGWWLKNSTKSDWVEKLNKSNFIFISHNHPDHLHPLTLSKVDKNIQIVVPKFSSDSTGLYMEELGFKNIFRANFNEQFNLNGTQLIFSILRSGDFREDSGIYFSHGSFTGLTSVDANNLNFGRFPSVDLYASSFAGGASGYPLMFENFDLKERVNISIKDKNFLKNKKINEIKKIKPVFFLPYAGFFEEKLKRDNLIKKNNQKNSINDYEIFCKKNKIKLLNVQNNDFYKFDGKKLISKFNIKQKLTNDLKELDYLNFFKKEYDNIDNQYIEEYFKNSKFKDNLHLYIILTNDQFRPLKQKYFIDFNNNKIKFKFINKISISKEFKDKNSKKLLLKIRKESFLNTVYNKLPWEDLLIGFQCKVLRKPNVYNIKFWHHFTHLYTTSKNVRSIKSCGSCTNLSHFFDNKIFSKNLRI